jgi:hypothetical protein
MSKEQNPKPNSIKFVTNGYRPIAEGYTPAKDTRGGYTPKASQQPLPAAPKGGTGAAGGTGKIAVKK